MTNVPVTIAKLAAEEDIMSMEDKRKQLMKGVTVRNHNKDIRSFDNFRGRVRTRMDFSREDPRVYNVSHHGYGRRNMELHAADTFRHLKSGETGKKYDEAADLYKREYGSMRAASNKAGLAAGLLTGLPLLGVFGHRAKDFKGVMGALAAAGSVGGAVGLGTMLGGRAIGAHRAKKRFVDRMPDESVNSINTLMNNRANVVSNDASMASRLRGVNYMPIPM